MTTDSAQRKFTKEELDEYRRRLAAANDDLREKAIILKELSERVVASRGLAA